MSNNYEFEKIYRTAKLNSFKLPWEDKEGREEFYKPFKNAMKKADLSNPMIQFSDFMKYLDSKDIDYSITRAGNLNFKINNRQFQLSKRGYFRSKSNRSEWYIVFKTDDKSTKNPKGWIDDHRTSTQFLFEDGSIDTKRLISRIEKANLF